MGDIPVMTGNPSVERRRMEVRGLVQGIGFRPYVFGLAHECRVTGFVFNHSSGVTIEFEGLPESLEEFVRRLTDEPPPLASIDRVDIEDVPVRHSRQFTIVDSSRAANVSTSVPADVCVCDECLTELRDPHDRRFGYPFINCTNCGPRFTIIRDLPYDRPQTTMAPFVMCELCRAEYNDPASRRFHAQPNACSTCGPRLWFVRGDRDDRDCCDVEAMTVDPSAEQRAGPDAIKEFDEAVRAGLVIAVRGIGGFHLVCDASNDTAIARLRERKGRVDKPFAIMVPDVDGARRIAELSEWNSRKVKKLRRTPNAVKYGTYGSPESRISAT